MQATYISVNDMCITTIFQRGCAFDLWPDNKNAKECPDDGRAFVA